MQLDVAGPGEPRASYLICTTPRTGSWLLCDALFQTGLAGYPQEYLLTHTAFWEDWGRPGRANFDDYLARVRREATTPNGVCGIKIHWAQVQYLRNELGVDGRGVLGRLGEALPGLVLIRLRRLDRLRQALSYQRAIAEQRWWQLADASDDAERCPFLPDFEGVSQLLDLLAVHERSWDEVTSDWPGPRLELTYEQLSTDLRGSVDQVLRLLGIEQLSAVAAARAVQPTLRRQSDDRTDLWVHQYLSKQRSAPMDRARAGVD